MEIGHGNLSHYEASKAALSMLTKSTALELGPYRIRINEILPGLTATDMNKAQWDGDQALWKKRASSIPLKRAGVP